MQRTLTGKNVLVLGLGLHGGAIGTILWLAKHGAHVFVSDTKTKEELAPSVEKLHDVPGITFYFGNQDELDLSGVDMIVRNPGVPRSVPILQRAKEMRIEITMDSGLFFEYARSKNIIGITGSKGKTTASTAIAAVMRRVDSRTLAVGIDGVSPLGELLKIDSTPSLRQGYGRQASSSPIIFELSSWRLEPLQEKHISPHIAVVTSLYKDHLNTYSSFDEYLDTKKQIIRDQTKHDIAILNADDERIKTWKNDVKGSLYWFSLEPLGENVRGIWVEGDEIFIRLDTTPPRLPSYEGRKLRRELSPPHMRGSAPLQTGEGVEICSVSDIPHTSPHELRNKLPAILIGILHGADFSLITKVLQDQPPLMHRLQLVKTVNGVQYVNDSAATMPDALIAALHHFKEKSLILILGGSDKALEFEELAQTMASSKNIKHCIWLPGTATQKMKGLILPATSAEHHDASSMDESVQIASTIAHNGDIVLLSPGATSFGLFLHEFDRGDRFIEAVRIL